MLKRVVLSFDDGRADTYEIAFPIIKKYGLTATMNVATDFILHPEAYTGFKSALGKAMTVDQIREMHEWGIEIASHGHRHANSVDDINESLAALKCWGIDDVIGFASPFSEFTSSTHPQIMRLLNEGYIQYIRSGKQVRRESVFYIIKYILEEKTHSKRLFVNMNLPLCSREKSDRVFYGVSISNNTTVSQVLGLINTMPNDSSMILIFHSILPNDHPGIGLDKWYWMESDFDKLCKNLQMMSDVVCECTREIIG